MKTKIKIITILLTLLPAIAGAETITWQEPIVFELNLDKPGIYESVSVPTVGTIQEVTANWDFQGEVTVMVSADAGIHFTQVVNGMPQKEGIAQGNQLCYRIRLGEGSRINKLVLAYSDTAGAGYSFDNPRLSKFSFRRPVYISGTGQGDLFNYPVKITLGKGEDVDCGINLRFDFQDVRFTAADGETLLSYFQDANTFWVKIPQIPSEGAMIYMYYGNPKAEDESSPEEVFAFFDDFNADSLNLDKWEFYPDLNGKGYLANGKLLLKDSAINAREFRITEGLRVEFKAHAGDSRVTIQATLPDLVFYSSSFSGAQHSIAKQGRVKTNQDSPLFGGIDYIYSISGFGREIEFSRENSQEIHSVSLTDEEKNQAGKLGLKSTSVYGVEEGAYFDWLRVRPYSEPEPRILSVGKEAFTNLTRQVTPERYVSEVVPVDFPIRILTVRDDLVVVGGACGWSLDLSADGGKSYLKVAKPGKYYYASEGDFTPGNSLRWQIDADTGSISSLPVGRISLSYFPGTITLISPNGKEELIAGSQQEIRWSAEEYEADYPLRLEFSQDSGATYHLIAERIVNSGSFTWQIPQDLSGKILIRISDFYAAEVFDVSDGVMEIE
ncbi:DUF2341 domain-containing protein [Candidatus Omnitrophota bacterium]